MKLDSTETATVRAAPRTTRRFVLGGVVLSVLGALAALLGSGVLAEVLIFRSGDEPLASPGSVTAAGWRVVTYASQDGVVLRGAALDRGAGRPVLLWFHGTGDCAARNLERAAIVAESGFNVFVAEYRGYGGCGGTPNEVGLIADGRAALRAVERELGASAGEVTILGVSLGTGVASALAAEGQGRAIVLVAPYTSIRDVVSDYVPRPLARFCVPAVFESLPRLERASQPVLVVHGTRDPGISFAHAERIVGSLGARGRLLALEGAGHDNQFTSEHWRRIGRELVGFLR